MPLLGGLYRISPQKIFKDLKILSIVPNSKPRLLSEPNDIPYKKRPPMLWPQGDLKCNWSSIIMSNEDRIIELNKRKIFFIIIPILFPLSSIIAFIFISITMGINTGLLSALLLMPLFFIIGIMLFFYGRYVFKKSIDPNGKKLVKVGWGNISREKAISSVKEYIENTHHKYNLTMNTKIKRAGWKYPEENYILPNGIIIKTEYSKINRQPAGWIAIEYLQNLWTDALKIQRDLDKYLYENRIANLRK
ncbi:MAG: hypothetical protein MUC62_06205 [Candidatus Thermoplasmatota archaeon]|jgi:hypothetical protein|nr:hypothetical protein [Candidatus Thermoplasmatota archaeon]